MTARPVAGGLHVRAANLVRLLDAGRELPRDELRAVLACVADSNVVRVETVRERR